MLNATTNVQPQRGSAVADANAIAIIGPLDVYGGFRALGLLVEDARSAAEAERALDELARAGAALVFIAEPFARERPELLERFRREACPVVSVLPDHRGGTGAMRAHIRRVVERAVGVDLLGRSAMGSSASASGSKSKGESEHGGEERERER